MGYVGYAAFTQWKWQTNAIAQSYYLRSTLGRIGNTDVMQGGSDCDNKWNQITVSQ